MVGDIHTPTIIRSRLAPRQQNTQHFRRCLHRPLPQTLFVKAAQWVRQHHKRVFRYSTDIRHRLAAGYERLRAYHSRGNAALFKGNSVVHTAR